MAQSFTYDGSSLANVIRSTVQLTEQANHGEVGSGSWTTDDDAGTVEIVGHKAVTAVQSSCSFTRTFSGYVGGRQYSRGERHTTGAGRQIEFSLLDINARLGFYVIRGRSWNRPRETISARLTALLASSFLSTLVVDDGFVDYPTDELDKNDYRGQFPLDVIRDCALVVGYNYFVYWSTNVNDAALWFRDSNASTAFSSSLQISNVMADIDSSTTFAASQDTSLERDPSQVYSGVFLPFAKGSVFRSRAATAANFEPRHGVAPNSQVKRRAKAVALADHYLFERRNEEDRITTTLRLPAAKVNLVRAGQRIQGKFSHYATEGYGSYSWFRVLERTVSHPMNDDNAYDCRLVLSPQEGGCSVQPTHVQDHYAEGVEGPTDYRTWSFDAPSTSGNLIILATQSTTGAGDCIDPPAGWTWAVQNELLNTGDTGGWRANVFYKTSAGEQNVLVGFESTGGSQPRGVVMEYAGLTNPTLDSMSSLLREHDLGYCNVPTTSYPDGPCLVLGLGFFPLGPGSGKHLTENGSGELVYGLVPDPPGLGSIDCHAADAGQAGAPIGANCYGAGVGKIGAIHELRGTADTSGSTASWIMGFTDNGWILSMGLVFTGDNCD